MVAFPQYIDTHSHLHHSDFGGAWQAVIPRALKEGVWIILIGHDYASSLKALEIAREFSYSVYAAIGIHPAFLEQSEISPFNFGMDAFRELAEHPKTVAIGEVGFDTRTAEDEFGEERLLHKQEEALRQFAALAEEAALPMIFQTHGADDELLRFLSWFRIEGGGAGLHGTVHHFTGSWQSACDYRLHNIVPTLTGLITRSYTCQEFIKTISSDELLIESECPHLVFESSATPRPLPAHLPGAVRRLATLRGEESDEVRSKITKNALRLFSKIFRSLP